MRLFWILFCSFMVIHCSKTSEKKSKLEFSEKNPEILQPSEFKMDSAPILIQRARILTAAGQDLAEADLLMEKGIIKKISESPLEAEKGFEVINGKGLVLTPGLIDVHSHMGVYPSPNVDAHEDGNEMVTPNTAHVWAEHGFWPQDPDLWRAQAGGITTIQVLPGSGNLVGGRSFVAKLIPQVGAREMRFPGAKQGLKMACGENPKRVYHGKDLMTRMGNVAAYRNYFQKALEYSRKWENPEEGKLPERDFTLETLVKVMDGEILLHFHCYRADDISAILDVAKEFGFKIRAVHHGLEAYKLADRLAEEDVAVATWADWWGFKAEAYDGIPYNAGILQVAGGRPIIHSDSAVDIRYLNVEAAKAFSSAKKLGLSVTANDALAWVTKNPAWALGLEDKIGTLEEGKMADIVAWDQHPFSVFAKTELVFINGKKVLDRNNKQRIRSDFEVGGQDMSFHDGRDFKTNPTTVVFNVIPGVGPLEDQPKINGTFLIEKAQVFLEGQWKRDTQILVQDGKISEIDPAEVSQKIPRIDAEGRPLTPGLIESDAILGLYDIELDSKAQDLNSQTLLPSPDFLAVDALNTHNSRLANIRQEGILTAISRVGGSLVSSMEVAFDLVPDQILNPKVALFGKVTKGGNLSENRAALWSQLRQFLDDVTLYNKNPSEFHKGNSRDVMVNARNLAAMQPILEGTIPWVVEANRATDIKNLVDLTKSYPKIRLVISGGVEAWMVSDLLAKNKIPVMLTPSNQTPLNFDQLNARFDQAAFLENAGVPIIIVDSMGYGFGRTRQEAGIAGKYGLSRPAALRAITETPGKVFGLNRGKIEKGAVANLVLWNDEPLEPTSWATRIWIGGQEQSMMNRHRALAEKYLPKVE